MRRRVFAALVVSLVTMACRSTPTEPPLATRYSRSGIEGAIQQWLDAKVVARIEPAARVAYINPEAWYSVDIDAKRQFALQLAVYCAHRNGNDTAVVTLIDHQSGRQLGVFTEIGGLTID